MNSSQAFSHSRMIAPVYGRACPFSVLVPSPEHGRRWTKQLTRLVQAQSCFGPAGRTSHLYYPGPISGA